MATSNNALTSTNLMARTSKNGNPSTSPTLDSGITDKRSIFNIVDSLKSNSVLKINEGLLSKNTAYELLFLENGNLVLYRCRDRVPLWSTGTDGSGAVQAVMQKDGNFILYTAGAISTQFISTEAVRNGPALIRDTNEAAVFFQQAAKQESTGQKLQPGNTSAKNDTAGSHLLMARQVWSSKTAGHPFSILQLQNDGNLIIAHRNATIWATKDQRYQIAKKNIAERYEAIGGRFSPLGLPVTEVQPDGETFVQHFRSGHITINGIIPGTTKAVQTNKMQIFWKGIECRQRQEGADEIYGTVATITPFSAAETIHHFPDGQEYWTMGGDGQRIVKTVASIYDGPIGDVFICGSLVEYDSGDIDEYKKKVAELITKAAKSFVQMEGVPAEATAADMGLIGDITLGLVNVIAGVIGADDDPYNAGSEKIDNHVILNKFKADMTAPDQFPTFLLQRDDDEKSISYTHVIELDGTDQGGDHGQYALYFEVRLISAWDIVNPA